MASRDLTELLDLADRVVPGLRGSLFEPRVSRVGETGAFLYTRPSPDDRNRAALQSITTRWATDYPEAGQHYCALRCWGLLIWQPVYVAMIGTHLAPCCPSLASFCQPLVDGCVNGFRVHDHVPLRGDPESRWQFAANEIAAFCRATFDELAQVIKLNAVAAHGLQADCVLAALLAIRRHRPAWDDAHVDSLGARWLDVLNLGAYSAYFAFQQSNGVTRLALDRKTCCHHYRRRDGELCSTCPKLAIGERIVRLNAELDSTAQC